MKKILRRVAPQKAINLFKHYPLAVLANLRNGFPSRKITVIGVTGTDGKTTTTNMIYHILKEAGFKVSMVSTINAVIGGKEYDTGFHVTSPDPGMVQKFIKQAGSNGDQIIILEVTSHSIDQYRFWGIKFDYAVITNITSEHLDYHKTWENYFLTKAKLIKVVKVAVLNRDERHFERLKKLTSGKVISFGMHKSADFNPISFPFKLQIPGEFNVMNGLAASAIALTVGVRADLIKKSLSSFMNLSGRMQEVSNKKGIRIVIDFAHTPNALENALKALRESASKNSGKKLIALIGAEGYRDPNKREPMGEIAVKLADKVIITSVDPRGKIEEINEQILKGAEKAGGVVGKNVFVENDRQKAIEMAINSLAEKGDIVGIFGKGHETSMNLDGKGEKPWNDLKAVEKVLGE